MAQMVIYLDHKLKEAVESIATQEDRSVSYIVREWIEQALKRRKQSSLVSSEAHQQEKSGLS